MPASRTCFASSSNVSTEKRSTPGIDATGSRTPAALHHEEREHQIVAREPRLAHHPAQRRRCGAGAAVASWESVMPLLSASPRGQARGQRLDQRGSAGSLGDAVRREAQIP